MTLIPYLFFIGNCEEAMNYYHGIFGGKLKTVPNEGGQGLMHADLSGGDICFMASDGTRTTPYETSYVTLSLNGTDSEKITGAFTKLSEGGIVTHPLQPMPWGDTHGALTDKYGVDWMVNIAAN